MSISTPTESQNLSFAELLSSLQSILNVDESDLLNLFKNNIYQGNHKFLETGTWSISQEGENAIITKHSGAGYLVGTQEIKIFNKTSKTMVPKRIPVLLRKTHFKGPEVTIKPKGAEGYGPDEFEVQ